MEREGCGLLGFLGLPISIQPGFPSFFFQSLLRIGSSSLLILLPLHRSGARLTVL